MLEILIAWALIAAVLLGLGAGLVRLLGIRLEAFSRFEACWIGWAVALAFTQLWNLLLPVAWPTAIALGALALPGLVLELRRPRVGTTARAVQVSAAIAMAVAALWIAVLALQPTRNADSGLYHQVAVTWARTYAVLPGLGNLSPWLGLHSSYFDLFGLISQGPLSGVAHHVVAPFLTALLISNCLSGAAALLLGPRLRARDWVGAVMLFPAIDLVVGHDLTSASPDLPVTIAGAVGALSLARQLEGGDREQTLAACVSTVLIGVVGMSIKPSFAATGGALATVSLAHVAYALGRREAWRPLATAALAALFGFGAWMLTEWLLTGYPLYPLVALSVPADWRMDPAVVDRIRRFVLAWGRESGGPESALLRGWSWVQPWLSSTFTANREFTIPVLGAVACAAAALARRATPKHAWLLVPPAVAGSCFWFFSSPDLRFAGASLWMLAAGSSWALLSGIALPGRARTALGLIVVVLALEPLASASSGQRPFTAWSLSRTETPTLSAYRSTAGLEVSVPADGRCWEAAPPCTPNPRANLELRRPGELSSGFAGTPWLGVAPVPGAFDVPER